MGLNPGPMTLQGTNTYLVGSGKRRILIDTGEGRPGYVQNLLKAMEKEACSELEAILLTHHHHDHIGGVEEVLKQFGSTLPVYKMPLSEGSAAEDAEAKLKQMVDRAALKRDGAAGDGKRAPTVRSQPSVFKELKQGMEFTVVGARLRTVATPGHTSDHVAFFLDEEKALFSGDCVLGTGTTVVDDMTAYMKSLKVLLGLNATIVYPGHGPAVTEPADRIKYYIQHRNQREAQIIRELTRATGTPGCGSMELVKAIYKDTPVQLHPAAEINVIRHLKKLEDEGKVRVFEGEGVGSSRVSLYSLASKM